MSKFITTTPSGRQWHEILTQEDADLESKTLRHAVYVFFRSATARGDDMRFFSLRDADGTRLSTCNVQHGTLRHAVAKNNGSPWPDYLEDYEALSHALGLPPLTPYERYPWVTWAPEPVEEPEEDPESSSGMQP